MATETPKATADKPADKAEPKGKYARAAESGDPAVQRLLAQREAHVMNSQPDPSFAAQREAAAKAIKDIDAELNRLGFTAE
jgi:hypothetical protein